MQSLALIGLSKSLLLMSAALGGKPSAVAATPVNPQIALPVVLTNILTAVLA